MLSRSGPAVTRRLDFAPPRLHSFTMERIHAPELPADFRWLGTSRPLRLAELRGNVVVLDFWTYC
jgi:hypothetical protein